MTYISMIGPGTAGETAELLRSRLLERCALVAEKQRGSTAFLMFESSSLLTRIVELLSLDICAENGNVIVDAFGYACGSLWADDDVLPLVTFNILRERGFTEHERESWTVSSAAAGESTAEKPEIEYVSPSELARLGVSRRKDPDALEDTECCRAEAAEPVKPEKRRRRRSYDPEL